MHITTFSKVQMNPLCPKQEEIRIEDIAHAQSLMTRANGHFPEFYSVGQHSIACAREAIARNYSSRVVLACLLHDGSEFAPILQEKGLTLELAIEKEVDLSGDPDKLERVFDNLLRNAVNYSYPNTVIQLSMEQRKEEHKVLLRVQNHGRTIAKEKLEHIFEQFFRVDASRSSATGGSGLGLAIARQIVEMHHGQIRAESVDEMIVFEVELPI